VESISFECESHMGLHINSEHVILEIVDENEHLCQHNEKGEIIVTDLDNYVMPFIRYKNGDSGKILSENCSCGRESPLMGSIDGRIADTITLKNGSKVHGVFFTDILDEIGWGSKFDMEKFQVVQTEKGQITFNIVCTNPPNQIEVNKLKKQLIPYFDHVELKFVDDIPPEKSGKHRYIKSNLGLEIMDKD